ncbi:RNase P and RNase MRP subunit [Collariella sp. IMI 366227]|nr:RNase P and RNase MRP subunit [Collariella sp. IMI 366227]
MTKMPYLSFSASTSFLAPSKGKRKRNAKGAGSDTAPPAPEIATHIDVGLSRISRTLQHMPGKNDVKAPSSDTVSASQDASAFEHSRKPYSVIFVARSGQSSAFHSHFPEMVALAAQGQSSDEAVRLVGFSKACEDRLSEALAIPRVSSIGLYQDAPQAKGLVDFVREHVAPIEVPWLAETRSGKFLETKIAAVPTKIGTKKPRLS